MAKATPFGKVPLWWLPVLRNHPRGLAVAVVLAHYGRSGIAWCSSATIARETGLHRTRIFRWLQVLQAYGIIELEAALPGRPSSFRIRFDEPEPVDTGAIGSSSDPTNEPLDTGATPPVDTGATGGVAAVSTRREEKKRRIKRVTLSLRDNVAATSAADTTEHGGSLSELNSRTSLRDEILDAAVAVAIDLGRTDSPLSWREKNTYSASLLASKGGPEDVARLMRVAHEHGHDAQSDLHALWCLWGYFDRLSRQKKAA